MSLFMNKPVETEQTYPFNSVIHTFNSHLFDNIEEAEQMLKNKVLLPGEVAFAYYADPDMEYGMNAIFAIGPLTNGSQNLIFKNDTLLNKEIQKVQYMQNKLILLQEQLNNKLEGIDYVQTTLLDLQDQLNNKIIELNELSENINNKQEEVNNSIDNVNRVQDELNYKVTQLEELYLNFSYDDKPIENSSNLLTSGVIYKELQNNNVLNNITDYTNIESSTIRVNEGDTYDVVISKLLQIITDDEYVTAAALNDLNDKIINISSRI